jgi:acyl-coenzyme A thioesterase PaaI-like protein
MGRGHPVGDFLEAYQWTVLERGDGLLRTDVHLPSHVQNPRGQLFGGFAPTYVDLISLLVTREGVPRDRPWHWLATTSMNVQYFAPVEGPRFVIEARVVNRSGRASTVESRFLGGDGSLLVLAVTSLLEVR